MSFIKNKFLVFIFTAISGVAVASDNPEMEDSIKKIQAKISDFDKKITTSKDTKATLEAAQEKSKFCESEKKQLMKDFEEELKSDSDRTKLFTKLRIAEGEWARQQKDFFRGMTQGKKLVGTGQVASVNILQADDECQRFMSMLRTYSMFF